MSTVQKTPEQKMEEALKDKKYSTVISLAVTAIREGDKDKRLIALNTWSKGAIALTPDKVKSVGDVQKRAITFGTKETAKIKSGDIGGIIKELSATYLQVKAKEEKEKKSGQGSS